MDRGVVIGLPPDWRTRYNTEDVYTAVFRHGTGNVEAVPDRIQRNQIKYRLYAFMYRAGIPFGGRNEEAQETCRTPSRSADGCRDVQVGYAGGACQDPTQAIYDETEW